MTLQVEVQNNSLIWKNKSDERIFSLSFQRTLRVPDDGKKYDLPPNFGAFPIKEVADYKDKVPAKWLEEGGVFIPLLQREAAWINFNANTPVALKIAAGKVNVVSGESWNQELKAESTNSGNKIQDYMVTPPQRWLDGFKTDENTVRQLVAMPLGSGYSVEAQVTGEEKHGGLQIIVFNAKEGKFPKQTTRGITRSFGAVGQSVNSTFIADKAYTGVTKSAFTKSLYSSSPKFVAYDQMQSVPELSTALEIYSDEVLCSAASICMEPQSIKPRNKAKAAEMNLAAGGKIDQKVLEDPHGLDTWDQNSFGRIFVHIVNSTMYEEITGEKAPESPVTAKAYTEAGFPWFSVYEEQADVVTSETLAKVKSVAEMDEKNGIDLGNNTSVSIPKEQVIELNPQKENKLDGKW